jgi:pyrroline-5-carboxylate reductase
MTAELVVVGGGRMGEALAGGLLRCGWAAPGDVIVVEVGGARRAELLAGLAADFPGLTVTGEVPAAAGAVIAVKPADVAGACAALARRNVGRVLSIAAGVPIAAIEARLDVGPASGSARRPVVLRAMPNTPAVIGAGASALAAGADAGDDDIAWAAGILAAVGTVVTVAEHLLDAVTGLSGSGPAYVFLLAEALVDAGVLVGLPRATAHALVVQTLLGSARLLAETDDGPQALRAGVTSPGGTTAAGLRALETAGLRAGVFDAVAAATARAGVLGTG